MKSITIDQDIVGTIGGIVDSKGNPAKVEGLWQWLTDSDTVTLEPSEDSLSCKVITENVDQVVNITAEADADLGTGVAKLIVVFEPLVVEGGQAVFAEGTFGDPIPKT